ncbi:MAG: HAMP domain-containing sensor histidine kinase [Hyphomicrobiales bacterium]
MTVFIVFSMVVTGYIFYTANERLRIQLDDTIESEISGLRSHYQQRGIRGLLDRVQSRSTQPGAPALLVINFQGRGLTGNIPNLPPDFLRLDRNQIHPLPYDRTDPDGQVESTLAMVRIFDLEGGFYLVIGRDVGEREEFKQIISGFVFIAIIALMLLGFLSWYLVGRHLLRRIHNMSETSQKIVAGKLSERLTIDGSGDEFDRLASNVNNMLNRIEGLMTGLKGVSDNIAHDLKTPLSRMRNRMENALSGSASKAELREALEGTIVESDNLIRTFDALLRIARVEAGTSLGVDEKVDLKAVIEDVCELYDPVAEEAGVTLETDLSSARIEISASRELVSQAIANLVDNAVKYASNNNAEPARVLVKLEKTSGNAVISVKDKGPGIPVEDYEHVTKRFTRLERSRTKPGSGLGLSLVSAVVKLHGGSLTFGDNAPGLIVDMTLPVKNKPMESKTE